MPKIKLTKNELKRQKDALKRFNRYLPTLKLKKQQLQMEIGKVQRVIDSLAADIGELERKVLQWADVFAEEVEVETLLQAKEIKTDVGNIASGEPTYSADKRIKSTLFLLHFIHQAFQTMLPFAKRSIIICCYEPVTSTLTES